MKILTEIDYTLSTIEFVKSYVGKSFLITEKGRETSHIGVLCGYYIDDRLDINYVKIDFLLFGFEKKEENDFWNMQNSDSHKVFIKKNYYHYFPDYSNLKLL